VLSNLLGQLDGWFCVGELRRIWLEMESPEWRCGCGELFAECPVWSKILAGAFGDQALTLGAETLGWQHESLLERHTWTRVRPLLRRGHRELDHRDALRRYAARLSGLYRAIADTTGAAVIVDSSKEPTDAALLRLLPYIRPVFVQIVRDPRGTIYSRHKLEAGPEGASSTWWMQSGYAALSWAAGNMAGAAVVRAHGPQQSMAIRYEDFVAHPQATLESIAELAGSTASKVVSPDNVAVLDVNHTVAGNDNRFRVGPVVLKQDDVWKEQLHPLDRAVATALCSPLLARYGYPPFGRRRLGAPKRP
jgi:hypothetical protein